MGSTCNEKIPKSPKSPLLELDILVSYDFLDSNFYKT
jgi:hypothetical protein